MGRVKIKSDDDVLATARSVFLAAGHVASIRSVSEASGLSQATLIQRFATKDGLFIAAMQPPPLDGDALASAAKIGGFRSFVHDLVCQIAERVPRVLALAAHAGLDRSVVQRAHDALELPTFRGRAAALVATMQADGRLANHADPARIVDALLVAAHGFTMMRSAAAVSEISDGEIDRFAETIAGATLGGNQQ